MNIKEISRELEVKIYKNRLKLSSYNITSLDGSPEEVQGDLDISHNKLTSLKGCTKKILENFNVSGNKLTSLEYSPEEVGKSFNCSYNEITTLKHLTKCFSLGILDVSHNKLNNIDEIKELKDLQELDAVSNNFDRNYANQIEEHCLDNAIRLNYNYMSLR